MNKRAVRFFVLFFFCSCQTAFAQSIFVGPDKKFQQKELRVPYAFYNDSFGTAVGFVYGITGYPQKQSMLLGTTMAGTEGSAMGFLMGRDLRLPFSDRLFVDLVAQVGRFKEIESYSDGNPDFPDERAGSNGSDEDNYIEGDGWDNYFQFRFQYVLPIGHGKDQIVNTYVLDRGLVNSGEAGGISWNPLISGKTYIEVKPFYRQQEIEGDFVDDDLNTNGIEFSVFRDNRNFFVNPSRGSALRLKVTRDWGWFDSSAPWTVVSGEFDKYFSLGPS